MLFWLGYDNFLRLNKIRDNVINYTEFRKYFASNSCQFWKVITKKSLFPISLDKEAVLNELYKSILERRYYPSSPRSYIIFNKGNDVVRLVPVFQPADLCVYYFCIKELEDKLAQNRVTGTYGGWSLGGNLIRQQEEEEVLYIRNNFREYDMPDGSSIVLDQSGEYPMESSFNPRAWKENWVDFNKKLYLQSMCGNYNNVAEIDIANFYDSINLSVLENKIRAVAERKHNEQVALLMHFLHFWNRDINFYNRKSVGIPQDETGDCSRILANFYLQDYDKKMYEICDRYGAKYFRFADDQIFFTKNKNDLSSIICLASLELTRIGLSLNQKKVKYFSRKEFDIYFAFETFQNLGNNPSVSMVEDAISRYVNLKDKLKNKGVSVLIKLLHLSSSKINKKCLYIILNGIINKNFLQSPKLDVWHLEKVYDLISVKQKSELLNYLSKMSKNSLHNHFNLKLKNFYKKINVPTDDVDKRIEELRVFYSLNVFN